MRTRSIRSHRKTHHIGAAASSYEPDRKERRRERDVSTEHYLVRLPVAAAHAGYARVTGSAGVTESIWPVVWIRDTCPFLCWVLAVLFVRHNSRDQPTGVRFVTRLRKLSSRPRFLLLAYWNGTVARHGCSRNFQCTLRKLSQCYR
jgi:hypothetical protein